MPARPASAVTRPHSSDSASSAPITMTHRRKPPPPATPFPGFLRGNLVELTMTDFLTFSHTVFRPSPRMNLILGPNGAGKSTIVSAVCIVFAGSPRLLRRNQDLASFVKHGANQATIEAALYDPTHPASVRRIKRTFDTDGKSSFFLDGHKVSSKQIHSLIHDDYDIQLDNLSQFMPQERITEFTNLSNDELLALTIRSLGGEKQIEEFETLSRADQLASSGQDALQTLMRSIQQLQVEQEEAAGEVQAFREQERVLQRAKLLKRFVPTLEVENMKELLVQQLARQSELSDYVDELRLQLSSVDSGPINARQQELAAAKETEKSMRSASREAGAAATKLVSNIDTIVMELDGKDKEIQDVERKELQHRRGIEVAEIKLGRAQEELDQQGDVKDQQLQLQIDDVSAKKNRIREEQMSATSSLAPIEAELEDISRLIRHHNHALGNISSIRDQRIEQLARYSRQEQLVSCVRLVNDMKRAGAFRGHVHGPVAAEIQVDDEYHQRILESCLRGWLMTAFVTEYSSDSKQLLAECRQRLNGWTPDIITAPTTRDDQIDMHNISEQRPQRAIDAQLREHGIDRVVADIFSAPPAVKAALNAQAGLHNVHVGSSISESEHAESHLRSEDGLYAWYTPTRRCQLQGSRFHSGPKNLTIDYQFEFVRGRILSGRMDSAEKEKARLAKLIRQDEERLSDAKDRFETGRRQVGNLKEKLDNVMSELRLLVERKRKREGLKAQVERMRQHVQSLKQRAASLDIEQERAVLVNEIRELESNAQETAVAVSGALKELCSTMGKFDDARLARIEADHNVVSEQAKHSTLREKITEKEGNLEECKCEVTREKKKYKRMRDASRDEFSVDEWREHAELFEGVRNKYASDIEGLRNEIEELRGRAQGLTTGGQRVIDEYRHRQGQLVRLNEELEEKQQEHALRQSKVRERKDAFMEWLGEGIEKMRVKFSNLYRRLGCSGDLELIKSETERIGDVALQILVSYRDDVELRPMSSSANSGGEKMCCTMLFCFSLLVEEERMPPFVFVDELNQGLDPENELKIMTIMFEDAEQESAPQSFVVSPKLLLNLPFHSQTKTHIIFNGSVSKGEVTAAMHGGIGGR